MKATKRIVCLLFVSLAVALTATPIMAACRPESLLDITDIISPKETRVLRTGPTGIAIFFVLKQAQGFVCNGNGGVNMLPPGCTKDNFQFKPEFSSNVKAAIQAPSCFGFNVEANSQAGTRAGFRIRFEENMQTPKRRTFQVVVDLSSAFTGTRPVPIPFTLRAIPDPVE
jgi:hypothetical protein